MVTYAILAILAAIGIYDLYLVYTHQKTISQRIHVLYPPAVDAAIMTAVLVVTWAIGGPVLFAPVIVGVVVGHLLWNGG